ncbi:MAG TPA: hypothetical protein VMZ28_18605 [Kofleriaceae bacterium]|nr:hypothetical protein [Kofleriaceae bacterium]
MALRLASGLSLALALSLPLTAAAQGIGQPTPMGQPTDPVATPEPPPPQPVESVAPVEASVETTAPPPPAPETAEPMTDDTANRPVGMSFALGAGYSFPASLTDPNLASARFRFPSGLTFEPVVELSTAKNKTEVGPAEVETETNEMRVATLARLPIAARGKVDLQVVGGAGFGYQKTNPDGPNNDTKVTTLFATWGLALEYWPKPRWGLSATALNPLLSLTKTKQDGTPDQTTTNLAVGAIWDPSIFAMLHMYF